MALLGQPNYGFTSDETVLVYGYYDRNSPAAKKLIALSDRGAALFTALGDYSVHIAGSNGQRISEAERIALLHAYLSEVRSTFVGTLNFSEASFDSMLDQVAAQETFLKAIRAVQPIVNAAGREGQQLISDYENAILEVARTIDAAVQEDFAVMLAYTDALEVRHGNTLLEVVELADSETPSTAEAKELEAKLDRMKKIFAFIGPRWELYKQTLGELNELQKNALGATGRERVALLLWVRAHQRMADGMGSSSWFDYAGLIKDELDL